jgi:S-(hydroxymethyl)glutathione dehydrogenase/alcohol dehydrogenase
MMRAVVLDSPRAELRVEEIPIPHPHPGEVLVKVAGCGVCHTDLHVIKGEVAFPTPCVLGHEISGVVAEVPSGTDAPEVGSNVVGGLPLVESAVYGCSILTAFGAVRHAGDVRVGETVAVVAIGGVGLNLVQLAHAFGAAQIIAVDVREEALRTAVDLGATDVVNAGEQDAVSRVRELTGGEGVDVAFEALGRPQTFEQAFELVRDGGRMVAIGIASGQATAAIGITRLVRRSIRITGSYGGRTRADMPEILRMAAAGAIRAERMVTQRVPLSGAAAAYAALDGGAIIGRAVVTPDT